MSTLLHIIWRLTSVSPDAIPLFTMPTAPSPASFARIIEPPRAPDVWTKTARQQAIDLQGAGLWNTLGLVQVLVHGIRIGEGEVQGFGQEEAAEIGRMASERLDRASVIAPELALIALEKLPVSPDMRNAQICSAELTYQKPLPGPVQAQHTRLLAVYLATPAESATSSQLVFHQMWQNDPDGLLAILLEYYAEAEDNLGRIMDIANEVEVSDTLSYCRSKICGSDEQILSGLIASENTHFALDVATQAAQKERINLEMWLADGISVKGHDFLDSIFEFVEHKIRLEIDNQHAPESVPPLKFRLTAETYSIFIRVVRNAEGLEREDIMRFKTLRTDILIQHPRLLNLRPGSKEEQGFELAKYAKDVSAHADELFQRMYSGAMKIDEVIEELERLKKSDEPREHELYASALHSLFDEYRFVKNYPPKELTMTGILFGAIIDARLVKDTAAFVATRYVLDACKSSPLPPHDLLYQFGINALSVLRPSLVDFPGLCRELIEIPALHEQHPSLVSEIMDALAEREELDMQGGVKLAFPALKLPILVEEGEDEFREPDPKKRDAIMFIINNIAPSNWTTKSQDLTRIFEEQYSRWFAHYFIDVRVSLEANRHEIYLQILDALASPVLDRHILWETYRKARDLLNSESTMNSASERTTLKTIANWLGKITLARNKPIRMKELSVKDLLLQGFDNKRLIVAIPFVCNLLTSCNESTVFHPPNPWLVAVLGLLVEFYNGGDIRLNLKFEIEVLFSKLGVALETIRPTDLLRTRKPLVAPVQDVPNRLDAELQRALNDLQNGSQRHVEPPVNEAFARMQQQQSEQNIAQAAEEFNRRVDELIATLPNVLHFDEEYPIFTAPTLQRIVIHSVARAIKEIIIPVVERSVTIAGISSRDLVQKDFGTEGDPNKMRQAAHLMVQNLAGNLALVTCKEALRTSMISNVRNMLGQNGFTEENMPDGPLTGIVNDNLDAACQIIKKAAMEKAGTDIDVNLAPQYAARRAHRDANSRGQQPFFDGASFGVAISHSALPDPLRLRTGGLSAAQLRVYEDFAEPSRLASFPAGVPSDYGQYYLGDMLDGKRGPTPGGASHFPGADFDDGTITPAPPAMPTQAAIDKFSEMIADMEKYIAASAPGMSVTSLPDDVRQAIRMVALIAAQSANKDQVTLILSQRVVQMLYKSSVPLGREVYTLMLQQLCEVAPKVNTEVRQWLVYAEDPVSSTTAVDVQWRFMELTSQRKLNVPVTSLLIRAGFINVPDLDAQLAQKLLQNFSPEMQDYVAGLIRDCSLNERSLVSRNAFAQSLAALLKARDMQRASPPVEHLLEDLRIGPSRSRSTDIPNGPEDAPGIDEDRLTLYFLDWVRVYTTSPRPEQSFIPYVAFLTKEGVLNGDDISTSWYRIAINCAVDLDSSKLTELEPTFNGTDALAKLIVLIVKNHGDRKDLNNVDAPRRAVYYFTKMMSIVAYSLIERTNRDESTFNQRAWTRFYTTMLSELASLQEQLSFREIYVGCVKALANSLGLIQPFYAPKFAFGWLSIVSHRFFMSKLLSMDRDDGWPEYHRCLMWLLRFMSPFLKSGEMDTGARSVYKATLKLLLVVLHDFPDFLVEYYHTLSTAIPTHCVQLRNIVLSAFPPAQAPLPDWYRRLDQLVPDMQHIPVVRQDYIHSLDGGSVKEAIDDFVRTGSPQLQTIVGELKNRIAIKVLEGEGPVISWNHTLLNAAVFYIGTLAVERSSMRMGPIEFDADAPEVTLLTSLAFVLDAEGQYYLLSVIADQLRYPSAHTLWFASFMLFLFSTATRTETPAGAQELPERIARVLVERVVVRKPHPWGLVVCFVELLNNESYEFWKQPFVNSEEAIYMIFVKAHAGFLSVRNQQQQHQQQAIQPPLQGQQQAVGQ